MIATNEQLRKKYKVRMVDPKDVHTTFDVRVHMNPDRILMFAVLYEQSPKSVPPIVVEENGNGYGLIDGRTRLAGAIEVPVPSIPSIVMPKFEDRDEAMALAVALNSGGSEPESAADMRHVLKRHLEQGTARAKIFRLYGEIIPKKILTRWLDNVQSDVRKNAIQKAMRLIVSGHCIEDAALEARLTVKALQEHIRKGEAAVSREPDTELQTVLGVIRSASTSAHRSMAGRINGIESYFADHVMGESEMEAVVRALEDHARRSRQLCTVWTRRLGVLIHKEA